MTETKNITKQDFSIVMPAVTTEKAIEAWKQYQDLKKKIVDPSDIQKIEGKDFLRKSYWRKIATFFNLSIEVVSEQREQVGKTVVYNFTCKAIAPNGRFAIGTGSCDAFEKASLKDGVYQKYNRFNKKWEDAVPNSIHNIRSTAETRATNRAISNLVGGGEVSAEEIELENQSAQAQEVQTPVQPPKTPETAQNEANLGMCEYHNVRWEQHGSFISHINKDGKTWHNKADTKPKAKLSK